MVIQLSTLRVLRKLQETQGSQGYRNSEQLLGEESFLWISLQVAHEIPGMKFSCILMSCWGRLCVNAAAF